MLTFYHPGHVDHDPGRLHELDPRFPVYYSEVARRGLILRDAVRAAGLGPIVPPSDHGLEPIQIVHSPALLAVLQTGYARLAAEEGRARPVYPDTFLVGRQPTHRPRTIYGLLGIHCFDTSSPLFERTWDVAYWSAQVALSAAAAVDGGEPMAYALGRPPGHHASAGCYGGFCYLNNAAIAAEWLARRGRRVAIVDVDYHHGNGTQAIFYGRGDVYFCSIHGDPADDYPYYWGYPDERGEGEGQGATLNLPLPLGSDDAAYFAALETALQAVAQFAADTLIISLGVDTAAGDPVGDFRLTAASYRRMGRRFAAAGLPTVVVQEGGYCLTSLGENVVAFLQALAGGA